MTVFDGVGSNHDPSSDVASNSTFNTSTKHAQARRASIKGTSSMPVVKGNVVHGSGSRGSLTAAIFQGPVTIGSALRSSAFSTLPVQTFVGAAINIVATGLILNVAMQRGAPFDSFGLIASAASQIGFGLYFNPYPLARVQKKTIGKVNNTTA